MMDDQVQGESRLMKEVVGKCVSKGLRQRGQGDSFSFLWVLFLVSLGCFIFSATRWGQWTLLLWKPNAASLCVNHLPRRQFLSVSLSLCHSVSHFTKKFNLVGQVFSMQAMILDHSRLNRTGCLDFILLRGGKTKRKRANRSEWARSCFWFN